MLTVATWRILPIKNFKANRKYPSRQKFGGLVDYIPSVATTTNGTAPSSICWSIFFSKSSIIISPTSFVLTEKTLSSPIPKKAAYLCKE